MLKSQRLLLALLAFFCSTSLFAQMSVNIEITGVNQVLEDNVRLLLSIEQQKNHALMSEARLRRLHKNATQDINKALQPFGYYRPIIQSTLTNNGDEKWLASYNINPGPAIPVGEFSLITNKEIQEDSEFIQLIHDLSFQKGDAFNHLQYENIKSSLAKLAAERGYFKAHFVEHRVEIDLARYEARVYLNYNAGVRFHFGEIKLKQNVLNEDLLNRYIPFEESSPYTLSQLIDLQHALNDSDYFQTVEVSPDTHLLENNEIPINVTLTPRKNHRFSFGLGYGSDTGARSKFGWEMPRLNKKGHRFNTDATISEIGYSLSAHYRVPILNPRTDQMIYSAGIVNETTDSSESTIRTIGVRLKRSRSEWRETFALNYQQEDFTVAGDTGQSVLLIPGVNWSRTWGNDFIYTFDGLRFDIDLRGASKNIVSDTDFFQIQGNLKGINSLNSNNRIITRGALGITETNEFNQLPSSVRFFAGGAQSVRGYAYQSLGPVDANGDVVGGQYLMIGSIEFEHSFNNKWGAAIFYDGGNAIDSLSDDLERGAGFGMRWKSPVGPVRIDLASAITQDGQPWRLHITIGPDL